MFLPLRLLHAVSFTLGVLISSASQADLYKCKDGSGQMIYQQVPCTLPGISSGSGTSKSSPSGVQSHCAAGETLRCRAARHCETEGALGATLSECMRRTELRLFEEAEVARKNAEMREREKQKGIAKQRDDEALQNMHREPMAARNPIEVFRVGEYWDNNALMQTADRYAGTKYTGSGIIIRYEGEFYVLNAVKRNTTDTPAIYIVHSIKKYEREASARSDLPDRRPECWQFSAQARKEGVGFFEAPAVAEEARRQGLCR